MSEESIPRLDPKPALAISAVLVVLMGALSAYAWMSVPDGQQIPVHWGIDGQPDRYGGKAEGLLLMPAIALGIALLFSVIPKFEPRKLHIAGSRQAYLAIWIGVLAVLGAVHVMLVLTALGRPVNVGLLVPSLVGVLFLVIGNFMGKMRSNWFMGIRTPWTLSSELSWNKTHRLGGRLFLVMGVLIMLMPWLPKASWMVFVVMGVVFTLVGALLVYSYLVWRSDPDKQPLGR